MYYYISNKWYQSYKFNNIYWDIKIEKFHVTLCYFISFKLKSLNLYPSSVLFIPLHWEFNVYVLQTRVSPNAWEQCRPHPGLPILHPRVPGNWSVLELRHGREVWLSFACSSLHNHHALASVAWPRFWSCSRSTGAFVTYSKRVSNLISICWFDGRGAIDSESTRYNNSANVMYHGTSQHRINYTFLSAFCFEAKFIKSTFKVILREKWYKLILKTEHWIFFAAIMYLLHFYIKFAGILLRLLTISWIYINRWRFSAIVRESNV